MELTTKNYTYLANAVVIRASKDYLRACDTGEITDLRNFFRSEWFSLLTHVDGNDVLKRLDREKNKKEEKRRKKWIRQSTTMP